MQKKSNKVRTFISREGFTLSRQAGLISKIVLGAAVSVLMGSVALAVTTTWTGAVSGDWGDPDNWSDGVPGANDIAKFGAQSSSIPDPVLDQDREVLGMECSSTTGYWTFLGEGKTLTIGAMGYVGNDRPTGIHFNIKLAADQTWAIAQHSPPIPLLGDLSGDYVLTKTGTGSLSFTKPHPNFTGGIDLRGGTLNLLDAGGLGAGRLRIFGGTEFRPLAPFTSGTEITNDVELIGPGTIRIAVGTGGRVPKFAGALKISGTPIIRTGSGDGGHHFWTSNIDGISGFMYRGVRNLTLQGDNLFRGGVYNIGDANLIFSNGATVAPRLIALEGTTTLASDNLAFGGIRVDSGLLRIADVDALNGSAPIEIRDSALGMGVVSLTDNVVPSFVPGSVGILAIDFENYTAALGDALKDGAIWLGSTIATGAYKGGAFSPGRGGVYRLGAVMAQSRSALSEQAPTS